MRWLRSAVTWLVALGFWLVICWLLWLALTDGVVPDPRRHSSDMVSVHDQPLSFAISLVLLCLGFIGIPAYAWISWQDARSKQRADKAVGGDRNA